MQKAEKVSFFKPIFLSIILKIFRLNAIIVISQCTFQQDNVSIFKIFIHALLV